MPVNPLRRKLAAGQTVIGPLLQEIPSSPELVEFLVAAGFDYVIVDGEHGGARGSRAARYGYGGPVRDHVLTSNAETMYFGLIEDPEAVPQIKEMVAIDGFDGCFLA
jgi:2-keto-3-deoxy-L-rhamnonate aldolase RhmA